jgi:hypothetical protein
LAALTSGLLATVFFGLVIAAFAFGVVADWRSSSPAERTRDILSLGVICAGVTLVAITGSTVVLIVLMAAFAAWIAADAVRDNSGPGATH